MSIEIGDSKTRLVGDIKPVHSSIPAPPIPLRTLLLLYAGYDSCRKVTEPKYILEMLVIWLGKIEVPAYSHYIPTTTLNYNIGLGFLAKMLKTEYEIINTCYYKEVLGYE